MNTSSFEGSRWWKFDFHTHTPASADYGKGPDQTALKTRPATEWLLDYMRQGIDCVAITDHNTAAGIQAVRDAYNELACDFHVDFREITIFPGVELSIGRMHVLAIFDEKTDVSVIEGLIGAARYSGTRGESDNSCLASITDICTEVHRLKGLLIPAHVDSTAGAFVELRGNDLKPLLECEPIIAMEVIADGYAPPSLYSQKKLRWSRVLGSDSHHPSAPAGVPNPRFPGSHYTWVKMGKPSLAGLRLALRDGEGLSLRPSTTCPTGFDPNQPPENRIESIQVGTARYCGRGQPLKISFNPWLNAVIGGRGSGKSSVLEFSRFALGRETDLPSKVQDAVDLFGKIPSGRDDDGAMQNETTIALTYIKGNARYRLSWAAAGRAHTMEEETTSGGWSLTEGDIRGRFPARVFSQRQIAALAEQASALLDLVDEAPEVGTATIQQSLNEKQTEFLSLRAQARSLGAQMAEGSKHRGSLEDVDKKLAVFKDAQHAQVLKDYQQREAQRLQFEAIGKEFDAAMASLAGLAFEITPTEPNLESFDDFIDDDAIGLIQEGKKGLSDLSDTITNLIETEKTRHAAWLEKVSSSEWQKQFDAAKAAYNELKAKLEAVGTKDVAEFGRLNEQRQTLLQQIAAIDKLKTKREEVINKANTCLGEIKETRRTLTKARRDFLSTVLHSNKFVRMEVKPYGWIQDLRAVERSFRQLIGCLDDTRGVPRFAEDILRFDESGHPNGGFIFNIYNGLPQDETAAQMIEDRWWDLKNRIFAVRYKAADDFGGWFKQYLQKLKDEDIDRLYAWSPEDNLEVKYSPRGMGNNFRPLRQASLGQKAAAILAFILSYGSDPLILDQPEDDLDNELIYDLIVTQIRDGKAARQIIVVTHNPNIVVNGDAELVVAMQDTGGACGVKHIGTLQECETRESICAIMEGGHEAFEMRYQRIGPRLLPEA